MCGLKLLWISLILFRFIWCLLPQSGYIHPDEFFQSVEVVAGDIFNLTVHRSWEFTVDSPLRSIVVPYVLYAPIFLLLLSLNIKTPYAVFVLPRLLMIALGIISEICIGKVASRLNFNPLYTRIILASSYVTMVYLSHTFSNSIEYFLFCLLLYACTHKSNTGILATIITAGVFNRPTFIAYAFIPVLFNIKCMKNVFNLFVNGIIASSVFVLLDTYYYKGEISMNFELSEFQSMYVVTPLNFLIYNTNSSNLNEHGLHPRWTHAFVNMPLLFGPLVIYLHNFKRNCLLLLSVTIPLLVLSIFPHQEPRFLLPLLAPISIITSSVIQKPWFMCVWFSFNILASTVYGTLHQGGLIPALFYLQQHQSPHSHLIFHHTYMPPQHLLMVSKYATYPHIHDIKGSSNEILYHIISNIKSEDTAAYIRLITPIMPQGSQYNFSRIKQFCPHLSTEYLPQLSLSDGFFNGIVDFYNALCLSAYKIM